MASKKDSIDGPLNTPVNVRLDDAFWVPVRAFGRRQRMKPTQIVNEAVREYLERHRCYPTKRIVELLHEAVEVANSQTAE